MITPYKLFRLGLVFLPWMAGCYKMYEVLATESCAGEAVRCSGEVLERCSAGEWVNDDPCGARAMICAVVDGVAGCMRPPSDVDAAFDRDADSDYRCGNGEVEQGEACDDGNALFGDGCSPLCLLEPKCKNDTCISVCGDGMFVESAYEACDDANTTDGDGCSADCQVEPGFACETNPAPQKLLLAAAYRDFAEAHPDFEPNALGMNEKTGGLVTPELDAEGKPVLNAEQAQEIGYITSGKTFSQWYRDVEGVNSTMPGSIVLWRTDSGAYVNRYGATGEPWPLNRSIACGALSENNACADCDWEYLMSAYGLRQANMIDCTKRKPYYYARFGFDGNPVFFPIDNHPNPMGPVDERSEALVAPPYSDNWEPDPSGVLHNFHFTSEIRFWFVYDSTHAYTMELLGDDDIWAFINGRLAVDVGGIHTPVAGDATVERANAAGFDIAADGIYEVAIFHAERQTTSSSFKLMLTGFEWPLSACVKKPPHP